MAAHRYWSIRRLYAGASTLGSGMSMAECYLRAAVGGANKVPVASSASSIYSGTYSADKMYDGSDTTLWHKGNSAPLTDYSQWVAFDYGAGNEFDAAEIAITARNDSAGAYNQTPYQGWICYSDTGLAGPWTLAHDLYMPAFTSDGQTQTQDLTLVTNDIRVQKAMSVVVARWSTSGILVSKAVALAPYNVPTIEVDVQQARALPVVRAAPDMLVQKSVALVVGRGRLANPHIRPWTFTMDGHDFLVIRTFSMTLVYDFHSGKWSTWGLGDNSPWPLQVGLNWNADLGVILPDFGDTTQTNVVCGDDTYDTLYFLDPELVDDHSYEGTAGQKFQRIITGQLAVRGHDYVSCPTVELTGSNGDAPVGTDMDVSLKISDDRGHSYWSAGTRTVVAGTYNVTLSWGGLGSFTGPGRLFRFSDNGAVYRVDGMDVVDGE